MLKTVKKKRPRIITPVTTDSESDTCLDDTLPPSSQPIDMYDSSEGEELDTGDTAMSTILQVCVAIFLLYGLHYEGLWLLIL